MTLLEVGWIMIWLCMFGIRGRTSSFKWSLQPTSWRTEATRQIYRAQCLTPEAVHAFDAKMKALIIAPYTCLILVQTFFDFSKKR